MLFKFVVSYPCILGDILGYLVYIFPTYGSMQSEENTYFSFSLPNTQDNPPTHLDYFSVQWGIYHKSTLSSQHEDPCFARVRGGLFLYTTLPLEKGCFHNLNLRSSGHKGAILLLLSRIALDGGFTMFDVLLDGA